MTVEELLYGDIAENRATRDLRAGEIVRVEDVEWRVKQSGDLSTAALLVRLVGRPR